MLFRLFLAFLVAMLLGAKINAARSDGLPEPAIIPAPAVGSWIIVESADALSPGDTAYGRVAASSGDVDPGVVTLFNENAVIPDIVVDIGGDDRRPPPRRRPHRFR